MIKTIYFDYFLTQKAVYQSALAYISRRYCHWGHIKTDFFKKAPSNTTALTISIRNYAVMNKYRTIRSAGCLIIGDEILNGKILDTNSHTFAKFCFNKLSIPMRRTIVCRDDEEDIVRSVKMLADECDLVVTSGGIGPTHDDLTYEALSAAYGLSCELDADTVARMQRLRGHYLSGLNEEQLHSFYRMATFPKSNLHGTQVEKIIADEALWVPIIGIDYKVYVLPGVPQLFERLLDILEKSIKHRIENSGFVRYYVKTATKESELAPFLAKLQNECDEKYGQEFVKLGSYPHMTWQINTISIIGNKHVTTVDLRSIVERIVRNVGGNAKEISQEEENKFSKKS